MVHLRHIAQNVVAGDKAVLLVFPAVDQAEKYGTQMDSDHFLRWRRCFHPSQLSAADQMVVVVGKEGCYCFVAANWSMDGQAQTDVQDKQKDRL